GLLPKPSSVPGRRRRVGLELRQGIAEGLVPPDCVRGGGPKRREGFGDVVVAVVRHPRGQLEPTNFVIGMVKELLNECRFGQEPRKGFEQQVWVAEDWLGHDFLLSPRRQRCRSLPSSLLTMFQELGTFEVIGTVRKFLSVNIPNQQFILFQFSSQTVLEAKTV